MKYNIGQNEQKNWIVADTTFNEDYLGKTEAILSLGNGYIGLRSANEESYIKEKRNFFISGTFNKADENEVTELPNAADVTEVEIRINGKRFNLLEGKVADYNKQLNLKTGELCRSFIWTSTENELFKFEFRRFVSQDNLHIIGSKITIIPLTNKAQISYTSGINGQGTNSGAQHFSEGAKRIFEYKYLQMLQETSESHITFVHHTSHNVYLNGVLYTEKPSLNMDRRKVLVHQSMNVEKDQLVVIEKISNIYTTRDLDCQNKTLDEIKEHALTELINGISDGYDKLFANSSQKWEAFWNNFQITLVGNDFDQLATRFAQYHLQIMTPAHDNRCGVPAKGLSGEGYKGHSFWDTEIFVLPYFTYTNPKVAKKLLEYRFNSIEGAHQKAKANGFKGAMYPWESAWLEDGETTPLWGAVDIITGESTKIWSGIIEQHITSDITFAIWQYYMITKDEEFMTRAGYEIMFDTAIFWASRLEWNEEKQEYHINNVVGPDEYKEHVDNDAFTNWLAYWTVETAIEYYEKLSKENKALFDKLNKKLSLEEEKLIWEERLPKIYLPQPRELDLVIPQNDTFLSLEEIDLTKYKNQEHIGSMFLDYNLDQVNKIQVIKQSDVVMLLYTLEHKFNQTVKKANFDFYEPKTLHDSSLSLSIHSILASDINEPKLAYDLFQKATKIDLGENMKTSDHGIHAGSMGGLCQILLNGFGGVRMMEGKLRIEPKLPKNWQELLYQFFWAGNKINVTITKDSMHLENNGNTTVEFSVKDKIYTLDKTLTIAL